MKIKEFGKESKYGEHKYWFVEDENNIILGIIESREYRGCCDIENIDYIQNEKSTQVLDMLISRALEYLQENSNICFIQILDNMADIKQLLERHGFEVLYISEVEEDGMSAIGYIKNLK